MEENLEQNGKKGGSSMPARENVALPGFNPTFFGELAGKTNPNNLENFERDISSNLTNAEEEKNYFVKGGKEGFHLLVRRLHAPALRFLLDKVSSGVAPEVLIALKHVLSTIVEADAVIFEEKLGKGSLENYRSKVRAQSIPQSQEEFPDLDMKEGDLESGTTISPEEEAKFKAIARASIVIEDIEKSGYSVIPFALEEKNIPDLKAHDLEEIILDLGELKRIIEIAKENTKHRIAAGKTFEDKKKSAIISEAVALGGYRLVPNKKNIDKSIPDLEVPQDVEVEIEFGKYLKIRYPERFEKK